MARRNYPFFTDEDVLDASEIAPIDDVTAGTVTASKAVIVGTNKNIDTLVIADSGLKLGSGAGTAVTATAAELNTLASVVAGTVTASKALVVGANKNLDTLSIADSGLKLGTGAGTAVTATAAQLNVLAGVTAGTGLASKAIVLDANGKWTYGTTATPISSATASSEFFAWRTACSATSGNSYGTRFNHKITGAGGSGAAIRGYGFAYGVAAANVYGGEFTAEENSTGGITGELAAIRAVASLQNTTETGTVQVLKLEYDVKTGADATAVTNSFITVSNGGEGTGCNALLNIQVAKGTNSATTLSSSNHDAPTADTMVRIIINGTPHWLLATTHAPADS